MKYVDEYRQADLVQKWAKALHQITTKPWVIMEVCGGQTHSIVKFGLQELLPKTVHLIHGPGCPVCVTPSSLIDHALYIAKQPNTVLCSFGDMLRVPGNHIDLLTAKAQGSDVRIVQSPLEALKIAEKNPEKEIVFFAVGFETTAPANAMAVYQAKKRGLNNFSLLASHVLVPPALQFLMESSDCTVQGFLSAGHVCTVTGYHDYYALSNRYRVPIIVTGFEPVDILQGLYLCIERLEKNAFGVDNQYKRSVQENGNLYAQNSMNKVFKVVDRDWRGIGIIPLSGLDLTDEYLDYDAAIRFPMKEKILCKETTCISGLILQGKKKPCECPLFRKQCTPQTPLGAPMVSNEGACSAYYYYSQRKERC